MDALAGVKLLKRNLERFQASKTNMHEKAKRHADDAQVKDWTSREIARLDEAIQTTRAQLDAIRAEL